MHSKEKYEEHHGHTLKHSLFYHVGMAIYSLRWVIIVLWLLITFACIPFLSDITTPFKTTGFIDEHSASAKAATYLDQQLGFNANNKFLVMYHSAKLLNTSPRYLAKIKKSLADLKQFPIAHQIILPTAKPQLAEDHHTAFAVVIVKTNTAISDELLAQFKAAIKTPSQMTVQIGGEALFVEQVNKQMQKDLFKSDFIATPIAIVTLIFVFGSLIAATLPIILGGICALVILISLYFLGQFFTLSIFTLNIALLLGLCLSLDYSLFIISRFRDELEHGLSAAEAVAVTQATAGKAIFFSGLAVFASLSALFLFPINILFSVAVGGLVAVFFAVFVATLLLPAVLSLLYKKINFLAVPWFKKKNRPGAWHWLAEKVVHRPLYFFFPILIILLMLGYPFLSVQFGLSDYRILPEKAEGRMFYDTYAEEFDSNALTPIVLVIQAHNKTILSRTNINKIYEFTHIISKNPSVARVDSIVTGPTNLTKKQYYQLYQQDEQPTAVKQLLETTTKKYLTTINVVSKYAPNAKQTKELITYLRTLPIGDDLTVSLTGIPVRDAEVLARIYETLPLALLWIMVSTYCILFLLLRSLFLPFKAILMNLLSLCACYGALVLVFQYGYLAEFLNFQPQDMLDISLLVIIFCALFGFSMDYEVFLLSRIKETYEETGDNSKSIIFGIEKSSRIITSAALIVIVICCSFLVADVLMVKAFGLGIAVAIFVDAFLIRTILVPATMALFASWNWYLPRWLDKILPRL